VGRGGEGRGRREEELKRRREGGGRWEGGRGGERDIQNNGARDDGVRGSDKFEILKGVGGEGGWREEELKGGGRREGNPK
jgi:hypothetical protein